MKRIQKITRVRLKFDQEDEFSLLGIVSSEADYRISLAINKKFRISLRNIPPVRITGDKGSDLSFSRYSFTDPLKEVAFTLFSNRSDKSFLLKKLKNVDYLLQVHDTENINNIGRIAASLKEIESITAVFNIDLKSLNDKNLQYLTH